MGISGSTISPVSGSPNHYKIRAERGMDNLEEVPIPIDSIRKYLDEGVIDGKDHSLLLLRYILDNKLGFDSLEYFALRNGYAGLLDCWSDICDWKLKAMGGQENLDENYKNSKKIFQKYLNNTAFCIAFRIDTPSANEAINAGISNDLKRCWNHFKYDLCDMCSNNTMNSILEESTCACAELKGWFPFNGFDFLLQIVINMINVYAVCQKYPISVDMLSRYRDRRDSHSISSDHSGTRYNTLERFVKHSSTPALSDANTMVTPSNSIRVTEKDSQCVLSNDNASNILDLICILMERPPTRLCLKDFTYKSVLGAGTFGLVVLCTKISTGKQYAMKIQRLSDVMRARAKTGDNTAECLILQKCKHPFINTLQGSFTTNTFGIMLFDYCPHDTLSKYLRMTADQKLPEGIVVKCTAELCSAVLYLHSNGIIHKDIKPGNILIAPDGHVQLTDFGSAAYSFRGNGCNNMHGKGSFQLDGHIEQDRLFGSNYCGTIGYIAPEVAFMKDNKELPHGYKYTHAVDWWSVGATAYRLLTGKQAADQQTLQTILSDYKFGRGAASGEMDSNLDAVYLKKAPLIEAAGNLSEFGNIPLVSFILALLDVNYETRLGSGLHGNRHIRSHPVFASMSWERLDRKCYNPFYAVSRTHCGTSINPVVPSMMQHVKNDSKFSNSGVFSTVAEFSKCSYNSLFKSNKVYVDCGMSFEKILIAGGKKNWISNLPFSLINYRKNFLRNNLFCDWSYQSVGLLLSEIESLEV